jgi:hypothetical protein
MNASILLARVGLTCVAVSALSACASSGQRPTTTAETPEPTVPAAAQAGTAAPRRTNPSVLTAAEIAAVPGITNAHEAVQMLRPHFLRTRSTGPRPPGMVGAGAEGQASGRRPGQIPAGGAAAGGQGDSDPSANARAAQDPGILIYIDRQRYGGVQTLREIPLSTIDEIRFLNVGEANALFGMGHPHGVIQIISKRGASPQ